MHAPDVERPANQGLPADLIIGVEISLGGVAGTSSDGAMDSELIRFLKAKVDADLHNVVTIQHFAPPGVDVLLESTVPMLDAVGAVADLYADADGANGVVDESAFARGRAAGFEEAVRQLALIYHDDPGFHARWLPVQLTPEGAP